MKFHFILFLFLLTISISCSNLTEGILFLNDLKESISNKYETEEVEIKINNKTELIVVFYDPKFKSYNGNKKEGISYELGTMAKDLQ